MNVYLIGYRGAGKTTVARLLAERLNLPWCDADAALEDKAGKSIRQIFADEGEEDFRRRETELLRELAGNEGWVIATGGGIVLRDENRTLLRRGRVVWLDAPAEVLWERIMADRSTQERRPNLRTGGLEEVRELLAVRQPLYAECAALRLDTANRGPDEVAAVVLEWLASK